MSRTKKLCLFALFAVCVLSACGGGASTGKIEVRDAWVRAVAQTETEAHMDMGGTQAPEAGMGATSAAYFTLLNGTGQEDRLLGATSEAALSVELHRSELVGEVMTMRPVESIEIPAGGQVELKPGGYHLMLIGLKLDLIAGQQITLELSFEKAGKIQVQAEVRAP